MLVEGFTTRTISSLTNHYEITSLEEGTTYGVSVKVSTISFGESELSEELFFTTTLKADDATYVLLDTLQDLYVRY